MSGNNEDISKDTNFFICHECGRGFSTRRKLTDHTKRNHKLTICNICKKEFSCKQSMERHKVNIHQNRQEENITNKKSSNKRKEGFCNICQLTFKRYYNYKKHQERFHIVKGSSGSVMMTNNTLTRFKTKSGSARKQYICYCCSVLKNFKSKYSLQRH